MRRLLFSAVLAVLTISACEKGGDLSSDKAKASYAIGQQIGRQIKAGGVDIDPEVLAASISEAAEGKESRLKPEEMQAAMRKMQEKAQEKQNAEAAVNVEKGKKFLEENSKKEGVKVTKSGLQYQVITEGKGKSPKATDKVKVHYRGTLIDGTEFDSSYKRGTPAEFPLNGVIPGWTEGLQLMKAGGKNRLVIPSDLAYGPRGNPSIPANSVLVFEVELIDILKK